MQQLLSPELLKSRESVSQVCDRPCPFCQREFERSIDLQQHVAGHLESTALLSLPNLDDIDESSESGQVNSNSADRNNAESRAGDFDRTELLIFLDNEKSEDLSVATEIDKELFGLKLKAESVSFDPMNEVNVEARQAYSSELAGGWLSRLPHELSEEDRTHLPSPESSSNTGSDLIGAFLALRQLCWNVQEECKRLPEDYAKLSSKVNILYKTIKETEELLTRRQLTTRQIELLACQKECKDVLMDLHKSIGRLVKTRSPKAHLGVDMIHMRRKLRSYVDWLIVFNTSCVISAPLYMFYKLLTFCSVSQEVGDEQTAESSSQYRYERD